MSGAALSMAGTGRHAAAFALATTLAFLGVCAGVQGLRGDLDPVAAPLSFYLVGPWGGWVQAVYYMLASGLVALAVALCRVPPHPARSLPAACLFVLAGVALAATSLAHDDVAVGGPAWIGLVHHIAASVAFLAVTVAMLLQSWRLRHWPGQGARAAAAGVLAVLAFASLWVHALDRALPRGASQKFVIVLVLAWLGSAAFWLLRASSRTAPEGESRR